MAEGVFNVAWITPYPPDRRGGGGQIRQAHLLLALAGRAEVHLICPGPVTDPAIQAAVSRLTALAPADATWRLAHPWLRRSIDLAGSGLSRQPIEVRALRPVRRALAPAVANVNADVVLLEYAGLAPLLPEERTGAWVLTFHNLVSRMAAQQAAVMPKRRQQWLLRRDAAVAGVFERAAVRAFDRVITCSDEDAAALPPSGQVTVVPNGVDTEKFRPAPLPAAAKIVMTGALYTGPNVDGATWFCHEVIPLVKASRPDVELDIVGAQPTDEVLALGRMGGVTVHADVADVLPFLHASRVAVVPLRLGSGTRLKALEALAAGRPVVGTSIGLEGLDLVDGQHALVADDPQAFATAILRLLGDDQLAAGLVTAGRRLVEDRYSWSHIADRFAEAVIAVGGAERRV